MIALPLTLIHPSAWRNCLKSRSSKKSLGRVSSVGIAAITQLNGPLLPASGPPETLVLELTGVFRQFLEEAFSEVPHIPGPMQLCLLCRASKVHRPAYIRHGYYLPVL